MEYDDLSKLSKNIFIRYHVNVNKYKIYHFAIKMFIRQT